MMNTNYTRGDQYKGLITVGQRVHCILYGGQDGIVYEITGEQSPNTCKTLGGFISYGGRATFSIVFDAHRSVTPESIVRGVQWYIYDSIATSDEITAARKNCNDKIAEQKRIDDEKAAARLKERNELPSKYPYLIIQQPTGNLCGAVLAAKNIRIELKRSFPKIKFTVKSERYSGGNSVRVGWNDGPTVKQIKDIISKYEEGSFNGMEDIYEYNASEFNTVFGGTKYLFADRTESPELIARAAKSIGINLTPDHFDAYGCIRDHDIRTEVRRASYVMEA